MSEKITTRVTPKLTALVKSLLSYTACLALGLMLGFGALQGYKWLTTEPSVRVGNFSAHFQLTDKKVIMYGTDWCPVCKHTRAFFEEYNIDYIEFEPEKDPLAYARFDALEANAYPVIIIGNKRIIGLNIKEVKLALKENHLL